MEFHSIALRFAMFLMLRSDEHIRNAFIPSAFYVIYEFYWSDS